MHSHLRLLLLKRTRTSVCVRIPQPLIRYETQSRKVVSITDFLSRLLFLLSRLSTWGRFKRDVVLTVECRVKESQDFTNDESQERVVACLIFRRHFTRDFVYECLHKHSKTDARLKHNKRQRQRQCSFDTDNSLDVSTVQWRNSVSSLFRPLRRW